MWKEKADVVNIFVTQGHQQVSKEAVEKTSEPAGDNTVKLSSRLGFQYPLVRVNIMVLNK